MIGRLCLSVASVLIVATGAPPSAAEEVRPLFSHELPNAAGRALTVAEVDLPPGGKAAPHGHGEAAVYAYVLEGKVRSQLAGEPAQVFRVGQGWFEPPGADHVLTENLSATQPARLLAVFVAAPGAPLKTPEPHKEGTHERP